MMKFITEEYLRDLYRKEPFNTYKLEEGQRLTPGATQYLSDKKIKINGNDSKVKNDVSKNNKIVSKGIEDKELENNQNEMIKNFRNRNLNLKNAIYYKFKLIESEFLMTSSEILGEDIFLAQNIISLGRKISNIRNVLSGKGTLETITCSECSGINSSNFTKDIDDCFEITDFYIQLKNSSSILKMNKLRCALQELQVEIIEIDINDDDLKNRIMDNVNSIINSLSQLICLAVGGKECQRKE